MCWPECTPRRHRDPADARRIAGEIYGGPCEAIHNRRRTSCTAGPGKGHKRDYSYQLAAAADWSSLPFLWLIRPPTLVISGDDDPIIPKINARIITRLIPNAELYLYHTVAI